MAGLHLSDDEQSERLKEWWKENGKSVIAGAVLGIAVIGGVNFWRTYQVEQAESAAMLYEQVLRGQNDPDIGEVGARLMEEYSGTPYAGKAALVLGATAFKNNDAEEAARYLEWAVENGSDPMDRELARYRLALVEIDRGDVDALREILRSSCGGGFESIHRELKGELDHLEGDIADKDDYKNAIENLPRGSGYTDMLNMKMDAAFSAEPKPIADTEQ